MNLLLIYGLVILIGLFGGLGDICTFQWAKTGMYYWFLVACIIWIVAIILLGLLLRYATITLTVAYILTLICHTFIVLGCDWWYYHKRLSTGEWLGIALGILAVLVIEVSRCKEERQVNASSNQKSPQPAPLTSSP